MRKYELKPFKLETDTERYYDILRSVLINEKLLNLPHGGANLVSKRIQRAKQDTSAINNLKADFPEINSCSVAVLADRFDIKFYFYSQKDSRSDLELITEIGSGSKSIHLKIKTYEDLYNISYSNLQLLRELEIEPKPCGQLQVKIKKFHSILDAFRHAKLWTISEEKFFEEWGSFDIKFGHIRTFAKLFKCSFAIWSDEKEPSLIRTAYIDNKIDIIISNNIIKSQKLNIFDTITLVLDRNMLKAFECEICNKLFKSKFNRDRHEKTCQNGTKYSYKEKIYGPNHGNLRSELIKSGLLSKSTECDKHFISFDIESVNTPVKCTMAGNTIVRHVQEVSFFDNYLYLRIMKVDMFSFFKK